MDLDPRVHATIWILLFFVIDLQDANEKIIFFLSFLSLFLFEGIFTSFFKDKKSTRSHKPVGIKVCLLFLLDDRRTRIQEAQKHTDPTDPEPDPQHFRPWLLEQQLVMGQLCLPPYQ